MPRHNPVSSIARNHRISNKTRLKIVRGDVESDGFVSNDDEEKDRLQQSVSGVDNKEANEHHLQLVLSGSTKKDVFIPTPDSNDLIDNYEELYPPNRWKDPQSYVHSSLTVEESASAALPGGFTYYMDERDKEWLDKNNEEARGEGTSNSTKRPSSPSSNAKGKGKETEASEYEPVAMNEDEFELVMGLFEKIAHENTEFLYHALANGMPFPPFSDYEPTFSSPLPPTTFAMFNPPPWLPSPHHLTRIARAVYPYWKERRLERQGHRIIPTLNFDEEDTLNESYVCFRRLEAKALRKTRVQQVSYTDKLVRLQSELGSALDLAKTVLLREQTKMDAMKQSKAVWGIRARMVDLKSRNPSFGDKEDESLFVDKERVPKKRKTEASSISAVKAATKSERGQTPAQELRSLRSDHKAPEARAKEILQTVEGILTKQKEEDSQWENVLDSGFVSPYVPYPNKLFKSVSTSKASSPTPSFSASTDSDSRTARRPLRMRVGRGGRAYLDRRLTIRLPPARSSRHRVFVDSDDEHSADDETGMDVDEGNIDEEADRRLTERWRFDDDSPAVGGGGSDEQDRILVDDYNFKYLKHSMTVLSEDDIKCLLTDPTVLKTDPDGKVEPVIPFRLGFLPPAVTISRNASISSTPSSSLAQSSSVARTAAASTPVAMLQRAAESVPRISGNGGLPLRSTVAAASASSPPLPQPTQQVPSQSPSSQQQARPVANGIHRPAMTMPHVTVDASKAMSPPAQRVSTPSVNGVSNTSSDMPMQAPNSDTNNSSSPHISRPQSQQSQRQATSASPHPSPTPHRTPTPNTTPASTTSSQVTTHAPRPTANGHVHHPYSSSPLTTPSPVQAYTIPYSHLSGSYGIGVPVRQVTGVKTPASVATNATNGGSTPTPSTTPTPSQNTQITHVPTSQEMLVLQQLHQMQYSRPYMQGLQSLQGLNLQSLGAYNMQTLQNLQNMSAKLPIARHPQQQGQGQTQQQHTQQQGQGQQGQWAQLSRTMPTGNGANPYPNNLATNGHGQVSPGQQALRQQQQMSSKAS